MGNHNHGYIPVGYMQNPRQNDECCEPQCAVKETAGYGEACGCADAAPASACNVPKHKYIGSEDGTHVYFETCDGQQAICVASTCEEQQAMGRILDVTVTLRNVCPGRRSAVGLTLTEVDSDGAEYARGFRAITVPAHNGNCSRDIQLDSVRFILPEDLSLQRRRHFICRVSHHYMDADAFWG